MTGRIIIDLFTTLDWVAQAPGAPDEDTSGGFPFGGWQAPLPSEAVGRRVGEGMKTLDALLLGRRTCPTSPFAGELKGLSKASGRSQEPHSFVRFS
ncbi:hypothetical protein [Tessaracoccus flavescens]|uniref:hypothetical protein n=1 Tax=Tessaracoccus flavescens TaxID=399497 RepID=UPI001930FE2F|nr:hypothetical protein [Tessaracoccus flavescens]